VSGYWATWVRVSVIVEGRDGNVRLIGNQLGESGEGRIGVRLVYYVFPGLRG